MGGIWGCNQGRGIWGGVIRVGGIRWYNQGEGIWGGVIWEFAYGGNPTQPGNPAIGSFSWPHLQAACGQ